MYNILMLGKPGGTLARTYDWHIEALNNDVKRRYRVDDITKINQEKIDLNKYNVFWFYAKAFHPNLFNQIKQIRSDAIFICGPNVLLDKPDLGLSDDWDRWYSKKCETDIHLDQVEFYSNHVKKFLRPELREKARCLDKCMKIDDNLYEPSAKKEYDCLVYSKKRRYDYNFEKFRNSLVTYLEKEKISFIEIKSGKFGSYKREDYFDALNKSKITVNLSLDECPGILNYESMFFNVPVIGSKSNVPVNSSEELYVHDTDYMTEEYLVRTDDAAEKYFKKIKSVLNSDIEKLNPRKFIIKHTSFKRYCDDVDALLRENESLY